MHLEKDHKKTGDYCKNLRSERINIRERADLYDIKRLYANTEKRDGFGLKSMKTQCIQTND